MMGQTRIGIICCGNLAMNVHLPSLAEYLYSRRISPSA